jgi:glycosyltransferase involved in cell wall biosynthesis
VLTTARRTPVIWFELDDVIDYFRWGAPPTGVQRISIELFYEGLQRFDTRIRFCRLSRHTNALAPVDVRYFFGEFFDCDEVASRSFAQALGKVKRPFTVLARRLRTVKLRDIVAAPGDRRAFERLVVPGDAVVCLGAGWDNPRYSEGIARAKRNYGLRFAVLIHDLIPISHEHFVSDRDVSKFRRWLESVAAIADQALTPSEHCRRELARCREHLGWRLPSPEIIRFGSGFRASSLPGRGLPPKLSPQPVLFVSRIDLRKNHSLLTRIWQRLLRKYGSRAIPTLLFIGRDGSGTDSVLTELAASRFLDGKIVLVRGLSDEGLRDAYRGCLFTVFPSYCEGWGLPVAESLAHGKFCVVSNRTSLPEVGGDFVDYFDPDDEDDATAKIERVLFEPGYLQAREAMLRTDYRPRSWADCLNDLVAKLDISSPRS